MVAEYAFGIIGGSGLYCFEGFENVETIEVDTPFGKPSSPIVTDIFRKEISLPGSARHRTHLFRH